MRFLVHSDDFNIESLETLQDSSQKLTSSTSVNKLKKEFFEISENEIIIPDHSRYPINDRFAICKLDVAKIYGLRFEGALEFSQKNKLHSETYLKHVLETNRINIVERKIDFVRVRCNNGKANN